MANLQNALKSYTCLSSNCYDQEFDTVIRSLRPDWFSDKFSIVPIKKDSIIELAKKGKDRPKKGDELFGSFNSYISKSADSYDKEFDYKIRELRPDWFENTKEKNKRLLLEMAKNGEPRPKRRKGKIAYRLTQYTTKTPCYDPEFDSEIRKLRPDWFDTSNLKKKKLLDMAKKGEPRPTIRGGSLGNSLCNYTKKGTSYDPVFDKKIRKLRPDWFER